MLLNGLWGRPDLPHKPLKIPLSAEVWIPTTTLLLPLPVPYEEEVKSRLTLLNN